MKMTMTQKILAAHAGLREVTAGQLINAKLDIVLGTSRRRSQFMSLRKRALQTFSIRTE